MSAHLLVDASIDVKWLIEEEYSEQAGALLDESKRQGWRIVCPPHFTSEVIKVLYRRTLHSDPLFYLDPVDADIALDGFFTTEFDNVRREELYRHAWFVAREYQIPSYYDALYVALADLHSTPVWTADVKLLAAVNDPSLVLWIGDYEG